ncbi:hypothetical protein EWM64_g8331 [Hericium alpestre]|uniref:HNH nuclease domain-containing protein n=1 Tax=Hericium alpestre TaxID=135208 RepID=A0A4Y9ZLN4_9AGAM|nr:hypothetical protein EWM64_g8331 [Hericium alpestre]
MGRAKLYRRFCNSETAVSETGPRESADVHVRRTLNLNVSTTMMIRPQSLPAYDLEATDLSLRMAYDTCLWLESPSARGTFSTDIELERSHAIMAEISPIVAARVLGYCLRFAHSQAGRAALTREINECDRDLELLAGLAHLYVFGLIRVFRNPKGPTPDISAPQSPQLSLQQAIQNAERLLRKTSFTDRELRKLVDMASSLFIAPPTDPDGKFDDLEVAHIISQSLSEGIDGVTPAARAKFDWARTAGAIMERFGDFDSQALLGDQGLNSPLNAFMSSRGPHAAFDGLNMWLTAAKTSHGDIMANTYDVTLVAAQRKASPEFLARIGSGIQPQIKFTPLPVGSEVIPAPYPKLIGLHAACAKIAHMSGAAEYLEEIFRNTDTISAMTEPNAAYELVRSLRALQLVSSMAYTAV